MPVGKVLRIDKSKITDNQKSKLRKFTVLKEKCSSVAENLNDNLRSFLTQYYENDKQSKHINNLSFSELRDCLSDILKKDNRFFSIEGLLMPEQRKSFRRLFADFITDRNIYTHGKLCLRLDDDSIFLFYAKRNRDGLWGCIINEDIVDSYFKTYTYISDIIGKMLVRLNAKTRT
ncbi:hypothetical protein [Gelidibacter salicanalis]|uniref:Uncharacterized protein n=1 Tax=Gelidibacter salicanalis TaxID=291193 RepID=A0A934KYK0_9FLAO|nr:hypothetical protein [Gelidibacter salicanalis]MBJ7882957.1 hypothetical protein [Gelidibacter salicanalis]